MRAKAPEHDEAIHASSKNLGLPRDELGFRVCWGVGV